MRAILLGLAIIGLASPGQAAEPVIHKGRTIQMGDSPAAGQCLALLRKGIDMLETLPPRLQTLGGAVKQLKCDPPRGSNAVRDNVVGTYTMTSKTEASGYIDFRRNPASVAAAQYAASLVTNGIYAGWHRAFIEANRKAATDPAARDKARRLEAILTKGDLSAVIRAECEILSTSYDTYKALDMDQRQLTGLNRVMRERGC